MLTLYFLSAVVSASRSLGIALLLYSMLLLANKRNDAKQYKTGVAMAWVVSLALVFWLSLNLEASIRFGQEALLYEFNWRTERFLALLNVMQESEFAWITGLGLGWGVDQHYGLSPLTSGVLGGDLAVAYGLGGVVGLLVLLSFWGIILRVWIEVRRCFSIDKLAIDLYILFLIFLSAITPVLMQLVLNSGIVTLLLVAFLVLAESLSKSEQKVMLRGL